MTESDTLHVAQWSTSSLQIIWESSLPSLHLSWTHSFAWTASGSMASALIARPWLRMHCIELTMGCGTISFNTRSGMGILKPSSEKAFEEPNAESYLMAFSIDPPILCHPASSATPLPTKHTNAKFHPTACSTSAQNRYSVYTIASGPHPDLLHPFGGLPSHTMSTHCRDLAQFQANFHSTQLTLNTIACHSHSL